SSQWSECLATADALLEAVRDRCEGAPEEATARWHKAISLGGYGEGDESRLTAGQTTPLSAEGIAAVQGEAGDRDQADAGDAPPPRQRGVREQRCFDRLQAMEIGAIIAFSSGTGGFLHARVCEHMADPARLLLSVSDGPEVMLEV